MTDPESTKAPRKLHAIVQLALDFLTEVAEVFEDFNRDEALNPLTILHWWRESWRSLKRKVREDGFKRTLPRIILVVIFHPVLTTALWLIAFVGYVIFNSFRLSRCIRRSSAYLGERRVRQHEAAFRQQFFLSAKTDSRTQKTPAVSASEIAATLTPTSAGFFGLPAEIRHAILVQAFGGRTMHMSLEFQHPFFITMFDRYGDSRIACHAKIERLVTVSDSHLRTDLPKEWVWFGCVCHRSSYRDVGGLRSYGAFRNPQAYSDTHVPVLRSSRMDCSDTCEPKDDRCTEGTGRCKAWPGNWPDKCQVGAIGWLLTCRQAYVEGFNVLYRTNTIHIASPALHRHMQSILTWSVLSHLTSLELLWDLDSTPIDEAFKSNEKKGNTSISKHPSPLFPSMACLRLAFGKSSDEAKSIGLDRHAINNREIKDILINRLFPMIDNLLDRIVPNTADVIISCPSWRWHSAIDLVIIEAQGEQVSRPQHAEIGGIKFWRQSASREATLETRNDRSLEEAAEPSERISGFWIHSSDRPKIATPRIAAALGLEQPDPDDEERRRVLYDETEGSSRGK
ncbi:unnamed protein product [Clonostachys solani]|uniref:DUF7730 domain-containing protein n=1 Tax=Clonostachys solani TaxID=160281 RepID=A0A9P0ENW8_9HYPO|nr:unnamed protein product [Clonostachys solani]